MTGNGWPSHTHFGAGLGKAVVLASAILMGTAAGALAVPAPPTNDNRADASAIGSLPVTVRNTTVGSTFETNEPGSGCASTAGSVWYSISVGSTPPSRIGIKLTANGDLDAAVDVYQRQRSQLSNVACDQTDRNGRAALAFTPSMNTTYLLRVAQQANSVSGTFSMRILGLPAPPKPPGTPLRSRGAVGTLDGTLYQRAAYSMRLTAGTTYKINLVKPDEGCMQLEIFPPATYSFNATPLGGLSCAGYRLWTPRVSGVWSFLIVAASSNRGSQRYGLRIRPASPAERAPGIFLPNFSHANGYLHGNLIDDVRLYRFDVTRRSDLVLFLRAASDAPFDLKLLNDRGNYLQCNCGSSGEETIRRQTPPGRYFVVVQAHDFGSGPFTLFRQSREITHAKVTLNGHRYTEVLPGRAVHIGAQVTPAVGGPVTITVEYFDPVERWQFHRSYHMHAVHGLASAVFVPPHVGRWRATVSFDGTKTASPCTSGYFANMLVAGPLRQQLGRR